MHPAGGSRLLSTHNGSHYDDVVAFSAEQITLVRRMHKCHLAARQMEPLSVQLDYIKTLYGELIKRK